MTPAAERDVVVVGAGVVGCAIARELTRFDLRCTLVDRAPDVGSATSKANTALLHTGFDAKPGTIEARLVRRGHELLSEYAPRAGIPAQRIGALIVAWSDDQLDAFTGIVQRAHANGYTAIHEVTAEELYRREPHLGQGARGSLAVPDEGIVCPFTTPLAFATEALLGGCDLQLGNEVTDITRRADGAIRVHCSGGELTTRFLINAAGLYSDRLDRMMGHHGFTVKPRRGELVVFDKLARPLLNNILLAVPSARTKGVLLAPTVFGNVLLGPTAEEVEDREDTSSTREGLSSLRSQAERIMPALSDQEVTAVYAGVRAATEHTDYQLTIHGAEGYACVGGIRSTGLSASMAIAEHVRTELGAAGLRLEPRPDPPHTRMPNIGEGFPRPYMQPERIAENADYGRIVCFCERVTRGEILDALSAPIPATDLDGLRRRTRALMGRCQGFFCGARVAALADTAGALADAAGVHDVD
jgi:glycerol-3-phosphate dehydrogenase